MSIEEPSLSYPQEKIKPPNSHSEALMVKGLVSIAKSAISAPRLEFTWPRHKEYDLNGDNLLTPDELFLTDSSEVNGILRYSKHDDVFLEQVFRYLPDSKLARIVGSMDRTKDVFKLFSQNNPDRALEVLIGTKESPHEDSVRVTEGFTAHMILKSFPDELRNQLLRELSILDPAYVRNIQNQKNARLAAMSPNKSDFPPSSPPIEREKIGSFDVFGNKVDGKKVYQGQFSVAQPDQNLLTLGVNDCVALGIVDRQGYKALTHLDVGMRIEDSIDNIIFRYIEAGGDVATSQVALVGGFDSTKDMIWRTKRRLEQAGLNIAVSRLLLGQSTQMLITGTSFYDFYPEYTEEDGVEMDKVMERIHREKGGRLATFV